jgi:hypothetical protein
MTRSKGKRRARWIASVAAGLVAGSLALPNVAGASSAAIPKFKFASGGTSTALSTTITVTLPQSTQAGWFLVASISANVTYSNLILNVTDNLGGTWNQATQVTDPNIPSDVEIWDRANAAAGITQVIAGTASPALFAMDVSVFSGVSASPLRSANVGIDNGTSGTSNPLTPSRAGWLAIGAMTGHGSNQHMTPTVTGFKNNKQRNSNAGTDKTSLVVGHGVDGTLDPREYTATWTTAMQWAGAICFFK